MIFAERKPITELIAMIENHDKILLVGCATCVAECAAGGEEQVETLAPLLHMALKEKGHKTDIITATIEKQCEREFIEELGEKVAGFDAILSLGCGIGTQALAEHFPNLAVYPGVNTSALTFREEAGVWAARCEACGDCVLGETFGICPVARCSKSLMNGPCGGTRPDGTCEVDEHVECAWRMIYERAEAKGEVEKLRKVREPRDWSNSSHGGPKRVVREDQRI